MSCDWQLDSPGGGWLQVKGVIFKFLCITACLSYTFLLFASSTNNRHVGHLFKLKLHLDHSDPTFFSSRIDSIQFHLCSYGRHTLRDHLIGWHLFMEDTGSAPGHRSDGFYPWSADQTLQQRSPQGGRCRRQSNAKNRSKARAEKSVIPWWGSWSLLKVQVY